jgi:hypothetical protein
LNDYDLQARVEARLRKILDLYARAHTVSDFKDVILIIHTAIEEVIDREFQTEEKPESFNQKVQAVFPDLYELYNISDVTRLRNHIAHPTRVFQETEVRAAARSFVDFTLAAWPDLFGSLPPLIMHPLPSETPWEVNQPTTADALPYDNYKFQRNMRLSRFLLVQNRKRKPLPFLVLQHPLSCAASCTCPGTTWLISLRAVGWQCS